MIDFIFSGALPSIDSFANTLLLIGCSLNSSITAVCDQWSSESSLWGLCTEIANMGGEGVWDKNKELQTMDAAVG